MRKRYKVKRFNSCYSMKWIDDKTNKELTELEVEEILHKQEKQILELEEQLKNAIVPKFKINQIVYIIDNYLGEVFELKITSIRVSIFKDKHFNGISYDGHSEESLFATKEEALAKLKNLQGE